MEMALMQRTALSRFLTESSSGQRCGGCGNSGSSLASRTSLWNWRVTVNHVRRGTSARSSGGSRRDDAKIVARTQKRRSRHVKGVTPTTPELLDELQAEEDADEELDQFEANGFGPASGDFVEDSKDESGKGAAARSDSDPEKDVNVEQERWDQGKNSSDSTSAVEEVVDAGDNTYVVKFFPEGKPGQKSARKNAEDTVSDVSNKAQDAAEDVTSTVEDAAEDVTSTVEDAAEDVTSTVEDAAEDVTSTVEETAESVGESLREAGDDVRESVKEGSEAVAEASAEVSDLVQDTAEEVISTADDTLQEVGENLEEAGGAVLESIEEVTSEGQKALEEGEDYVRGQMEESREELDEKVSALRTEAEKAGDRLGQAGEKVSEEAGKSFQNIQESLKTLIDDSAKAVGTIQKEASVLGEVVLSAAAEVAGFQGTKEQSSASNGSVSVEERPETKSSKTDKGEKPSPTQGKQQIEGGSYKSSQPKEDLEEEKNLYKGLKVTVAGASGRTGRLLVEELASKGVPVRAVVRDTENADARGLQKLSNVEVVQADLYKYESIKKALGDSNVVISAVGARSFAFDPIGTYQGEFEGVKNLVAAAKNKGDVKKFVFVTSLGVTFLQIVPLLFWKKQSELYLQRSGLDYTIVRPGGLTNGRNAKEGISMKAADTQFGGSISRQKVAEVCVAALITPEASEKIVEIVSGGGAGRSFSDLFGSV